MAKQPDFITALCRLAARSPVHGAATAATLFSAGAIFPYLASLEHYGSLLRTLAWALAVILAGASGYGFLTAGRRAARFDRQRSIETLHALTWREFELLVADAYRRLGYTVIEGTGQRDGGIDLTLRKTGEQDRLVQCKQYRSWKVGEPKVREFFGAMAAYPSTCTGIFVTCGEYTAEARRFAEGKAIELVDGTELLRLVTDLNGHVRVSVTKPGSPAVEVPQCPACGGPMVKRVAKQGRNAGNEFWGCSLYPKCRGIVEV